jgi:regulator of replication initiation timing
MAELGYVMAFVVPMLGVFGLFWNVARKLGQIETELHQVVRENRKLSAEVLALRTLLSMLVDSRTKAG